MKKKGLIYMFLLVLMFSFITPLNSGNDEVPRPTSIKEKII